MNGGCLRAKWGPVPEALDAWFWCLILQAALCDHYVITINFCQSWHLLLLVISTKFQPNDRKRSGGSGGRGRFDSPMYTNPRSSSLQFSCLILRRVNLILRHFTRLLWAWSSSHLCRLWTRGRSQYMLILFRNSHYEVGDDFIICKRLIVIILSRL